MAGVERLKKLKAESGKQKAEDGSQKANKEPGSGNQKSQWKTGYDGNVYVVKVRTEKRRGKLVTIAWNFQAHPKELHDLLAKCKKQFGTGGQVTDNALEIQGDHVDRLKKLLTESGFKTK